MTEDDARARIAELHGITATERVALFLERVMAENQAQNLVSPASIEAIWSRHALDSAQLLALAPAGWCHWLDIGTGGGFPGMIVALLAPKRVVTMVEPRRKRADFLSVCTAAFGLSNARVVCAKVESISESADVISARAVASVEKLLHAAGECATSKTTWLLPRGQSAERDRPFLSQLKPSMFHVEHSVTDPASSILVIRGYGR